MLLASLLAAWAAAWLAWETAVHAVAFDGDFSDGPFQLFNVLRRIAGGQIWGRDFQTFTGIAANWAHLPVFFIAGGDFRASEISRFLTSGLCHALAAVALARAFAPAFPSRAHALLFGMLFFAAGAALYGRIFQPGASLLGVRTFFPLLLAAALTAPRPAPWIALALAASLFSSVDHALASLIALASAIGVTFVLKAAKDRRAPLLLGTAAGLVLFTAILFAATAGHVAEPLRYAFFDIPADQFWYFGAPPVQFLPLNARALLEHPTYAQFGLTWLLGAGASVALYRRHPTLAPAVVFMLVYATLGTVSQLGYISPINLHGSERLLFALVLAALLATGTPRLVTLGTMAVALCIAVAAAKRLQPSPMPQQGDYLSAEWRRHLAAVDRHAGAGSHLVRLRQPARGPARSLPPRHRLSDPRSRSRAPRPLRRPLPGDEANAGAPRPAALALRGMVPAAQLALLSRGVPRLRARLRRRSGLPLAAFWRAEGGAGARRLQSRQPRLRPSAGRANGHCLFGLGCLRGPKPLAVAAGAGCNAASAAGGDRHEQPRLRHRLASRRRGLRRPIHIPGAGSRRRAGHDLPAR